MDEETKEVVKEQEPGQAAEKATIEASPDTVQPDEKGVKKITGKILAPLQRLGIPNVFQKLKNPVAFNTFNVIVLLGILFVLIVQPYWKKPAPLPVGTGIEDTPLPSEIVDPDDMAEELPLEQEPEEAAEISKEETEETSDAVDSGPGDVIEANTAFKRRRYEKALAEYLKVAAQLSPTSDVEEDFVQYQIGKCYQGLERYDDALTTYRNVITGYFESPYRVKAMLGEGECLIESGSFLKGRKHLFILMAQEAMFSEEDRVHVAKAYYRIAESYMKEALRYARLRGLKFDNAK